jgi:hypothetical protein
MKVNDIGTQQTAYNTNFVEDECDAFNAGYV